MAGEAPAQSHSATRDLRAAGLDVRPWFLQAGPQLCCVSEETLFLLVLWAWDHFRHPPDDGLSENQLVFSLTRLDIPWNRLIFSLTGLNIPWRGFLLFPFFSYKQKNSQTSGHRVPRVSGAGMGGLPRWGGVCGEEPACPQPRGAFGRHMGRLAGSSILGPNVDPAQPSERAWGSARRGLRCPWETPACARPWYLGV